MTKAKAESVASSLINLGFPIKVFKFADDEFVIEVEGTGTEASVVANFANTNTVSAKVLRVQFQ